MWIPEKIGALLLDDIALFTMLTPFANSLLIQENCMTVPPFICLYDIKKFSNSNNRGCGFVEKSVLL